MSARVKVRNAAYWDDVFEQGTDFRSVSDDEMDLFRKYVRPKPGMTAVDVGTGRGDFAHRLARLGLHTTGYDFSRVAVDAARSKWVHAHLRYEVHDFDAQAIPHDLAPGSIDIVTCRLSLAFIDRARFITDVRRWLRPDGVLHVMTQVDEKLPTSRKDRGLTEEALHHIADGWRESQRYDVCAEDGCLTAVAVRGPYR